MLIEDTMKSIQRAQDIAKEMYGNSREDMIEKGEEEYSKEVELQSKSHDRTHEDAPRSRFSWSWVCLYILITAMYGLAMFQGGRLYQAYLVKEEIQSGSRTTIKIPSAGVTIHAPSGRIMTVYDSNEPKNGN